MFFQEKKEINNLLNSINENNCILFVGSGISHRIKNNQGEKFPLWIELLNKLLTWELDRGLIKQKEVCYLKQILDKEQYTVAAHILKQKLTEQDLGEFFDNIFRIDSIKFDEVYRYITEIPFKAIITTNYDNLLERAYLHYLNKDIPVFTQKELNQGDVYLRKGEFFIYKIHGTYNRPDTITFGENDYLKLMYNNHLFNEFTKNLFTNSSILFCGFNYNDPDISLLLESMHMIYKKAKPLNFLLTPELSLNPLEISYYKDIKRLQVLEYSNKSNHEGIEYLFEFIHSKIKKN